MLRCVLVLILALTAGLPAYAQRVFQQNALRGELTITQPPEALLNGKPARLAPGARIRNTMNMIQMSGTLLGEKLAVNYTMDASGLVQDVWILTSAELAKKPWPSTATEARTWRFDSTMQTWAKP